MELANLDDDNMSNGTNDTNLSASVNSAKSSMNAKNNNSNLINFEKFKLKFIFSKRNIGGNKTIAKSSVKCNGPGNQQRN